LGLAIKLILKQKEIELMETTILVKDAMQQLGLSPAMYLLVCHGELIDENTLLQDGDVVKLISAITGGNG
jgi:sulfur carrier protein ThiS